MPSPGLPSSREFVTQLLNSLRAYPPASASADATGTAAPNRLENAPELVKKQLLALHVLFPNELLPALDLLDRRLVTRFRIRGEQGQAKVAAQEPSVAISNSTAALCGCEHSRKEVQPLSGAADGQTARVDSASATNQLLATAAGTARQTPPSGTELPDAEMTGGPWISPRDGLAVQDESGVTMVPQQDPSQHLDTVYYVRSAQQRSSRFSASYDSTTLYEVRLNAWNCSCPAFAFSAFPSVHPEPPFPVYNLAEVPDEGSDVKLKKGEQCHGWSFGGMSLSDGTPPVCKHLLACVLAERCSGLFGGFMEDREVSLEEAAGWAAGWGD